MRMFNDRVLIRLPIGKGLLEMILFELQCILDGQWYLLIMYRALFALVYYGLFRVGELAKGTHPVKAADVQLARNKNKLRLLLWTSKNLVPGHSPQQVKITEEVQNNKTAGKFSHFCPFKLTSEFLRIRGGYKNKFEQFFVLQDSSPVTMTMVRTMLKKSIKKLNLDCRLYNTHSFRIGRCSDLLKMGVPIEKIKLMGRWKSNAVFKYIRQ